MRTARAVQRAMPLAAACTSARGKQAAVNTQCVAPWLERRSSNAYLAHHRILRSDPIFRTLESVPRSLRAGARALNEAGIAAWHRCDLAGAERGHRAADLFLDTHTCNAHTAAAGALWAGLPLLAWPADAFAGRVSASLLHAIGLAELVVPDQDTYERTAIAIARDPGRLAALRARLAANRSRMPLFDTEGFTRSLEAAYEEMWRRHRAQAARR